MAQKISIQEQFPSAEADALFSRLSSAFNLEKQENTIMPLLQIADEYKKSKFTHATPHDVTRSLRRYHAACVESDSPAQRGILYRGLFGSLRENVLTAGWNIILWEKLLELEPADVDFMLRVQDGKGQLQISDDNGDLELAERLKAKGLVFIDHSPDTSMITIFPRGALAKMCSFLMG